jgi:phosphohistidine phosphatase
MKLYCVRHGQACSAALDPRCPLTVQGQRDVTALAHHMLQLGIKIPHIFHSGKPRTQQTANILANVLKVEKITESPSMLNCEAHIEDLLTCLPAWNEDTLLVGHLPFMPRLVNALVLGLEYADHPPIIHFPPATLVCLEKQDQAWLIRWVFSPPMPKCWA